MAEYLNMKEVDNYRLAWESPVEWELRSKFLSNHRDKYPLERLICLSQVFANVEFLGCRYPNPVMQEIATLSRGLVENYRDRKKKEQQINFVKAQSAKTQKKKGKAAGSGKFIKFVSAEDNNMQSNKSSKTCNPPIESAESNKAHYGATPLRSDSNVDQSNEMDDQYLTFMKNKFISLGKNIDKKFNPNQEIHNLFDLCCQKANIEGRFEVNDVQPAQKGWPPTFSCEVFCNEILVSYAEDSSKKKCKKKAFTEALTKLSNPSLDIVKNENKGYYEVVISNAFSQQRKRKFNDSGQGVSVDPNKTVQDFVIIDRTETGVLYNPVTILTGSAGFCKVSIQFDFDIVDYQGQIQNKCYVIVAGEVVGEAMACGKVEAKRLAATDALERLKAICPCVKVKSFVNDDAVEITRKEVQLGDVNKINESISNDNIGNKMLRKMGWVGGGIGKEGNTGIAEPVRVNGVFNREGLGLGGKDCTPAEFKAVMENLIKNYAKNRDQEDLVFSPEFTKDERKIIHMIANRFHLKNTSRGRSPNRYLTLMRKRSAPELIRHLQNSGGSMGKFELVQNN